MCRTYNIVSIITKQVQLTTSKNEHFRRNDNSTRTTSNEKILSPPFITLNKLLKIRVWACLKKNAPYPLFWITATFSYIVITLNDSVDRLNTTIFHFLLVNPWNDTKRISVRWGKFLRNIHVSMLSFTKCCNSYYMSRLYFDPKTRHISTCYDVKIGTFEPLVE